MMKRLAFLALGLALTVPATAQVSGSINRDAPTAKSAVEFKDGGKVSVSHTAIHFGEGGWMAAAEDEAARERLNEFAPKKPIGKVSTSMDMVAAGKAIPAGNYAMFFTVHESGTWILNLRPEGQEDAELIRWGLRLKETEHNYSRLVVTVVPGEKAGTASVVVAFGKQMVIVPVAPKGEESGN